MEELLKKLAEHLGFAAPFGYAALAFSLFSWADKELSVEAKDLLARTMRFKDYKNEQIASALVEVFDRIYTGRAVDQVVHQSDLSRSDAEVIWDKRLANWLGNLLGWRAFFRSSLFTTIILAIYVFELYRYGLYRPTDLGQESSVLLISWVFNVFTDYLSLFAIRPALTQSGKKPVAGLFWGFAWGCWIVFLGQLARAQFVEASLQGWETNKFRSDFLPDSDAFLFSDYLVWPAFAVLAWLPLFALGIVIVRLLTPLSSMVGTVQWFLKEGKEHPLKAIGYVAAVVVFLATVAGRVVLSAWKVAL